jgi:hypothetical protein
MQSLVASFSCEPGSARDHIPDTTCRSCWQIHAHWQLGSLKARQTNPVRPSGLQNPDFSNSSVENSWDIHRIECAEQPLNLVSQNSVQVSSSSNTSLVQQVNATVNH